MSLYVEWGIDEVLSKSQHNAYKGWDGVMVAVISNDQICCYSLKGHSRIEEYEAETVSDRREGRLMWKCRSF